ncbi:MAG: STAS domain-containing protein [Sedimentisphaerales bacterium]|nr:STAS domain-containing protein [Sedimentisphaerales bacterium]
MEVKSHTCESQEGVDIVNLSGRLGVEEAEQLEGMLSKALTQCETGMILDMTDVSFISSAGLRVLVQLRQAANDAGKTIAMMNVQPAVYKIFKLTSFEKIIGVFENEKQAIKAITK